MIFHENRLPKKQQNLKLQSAANYRWLGNHGQPGKLLKKSSMHGKIMKFEKKKKRIIMEKSWNFVK